MTKYRNGVALTKERRRESKSRCGGMNTASEGVVMAIARGSLKGCCAGCAVPVGVFKAMQVAAGLALPKDIRLKIARE